MRKLPPAAFGAMFDAIGRSSPGTIVRPLRDISKSTARRVQQAL
jgi:hypothetical protein